ncbi:MAG: penicillin-insensitive murein endopeptidase [Myxococcales bacterium]|nr:penicillin-insensitive murein endopeptidase [Myxococcales bacterium]
MAARAATAATLLCLALASLGAPVAAWAAEPAEDEEVEPGFFTLWPEWGAAVVHTGWAAVVPELPIKALLNWHPPAAAGSAVKGRLLFGVQMKPSRGVHIRHPELAWTVPEVIHALEAAQAHVRQRLPGGPDLQVGDISRPGGGRFRPHFSHRNGLDVDLRYFLEGVAPGDHEHHFVAEHLLDCARTWAFIDHLVEQDAVDLMYMDVRLQKRLYKYARKQLQRTDEELDPILSYPKAKRRKSALIQHARGHFNHLHIRFRAPWARFIGSLYSFDAAVALARRVEIATTGKIKHVVRRGETLGKIAEKHRVKLADLLRWNGLKKTSKIRPGKVVFIRVARD